MPFNIVEVDNKVDVQKVGADSKDYGFKNRTGNLASGVESVILNTDNPYVLDYLEWSCNHISDIRLLIRAYNKEFPEGVAITRIVGVNGSQIYNSANPENILNQHSGIWDILEFHEGNNRFKFRLNLRNLEFAKGLKISIENTGTSDRNATALIYGREL